MFAPGQNQLLANLSLLLFFKDLSIVRFYDFKKNFRGMCFTVQLSKIVLHCRLSQTALLLYHVVSCLSRTFFNFFEVVFVSLLQQLWYLITSNRLLSRTFFISFWQLCDLCEISQTQLYRIPPLPGFVNTFFNFSYNLFIHVFYYISDTWLTHQYIVS